MGKSNNSLKNFRKTEEDIRQNSPEAKGPSYDVTRSSGFLKELWKRINDVDVTGLGAQLAFFFLLSIFPLLIFLITLLPYLNIAEEQVYLFMSNVVPGEVYILIEETLKEILTEENRSLLSFGLIATIWSASLGMNALIKSLNRSYGVEENRPILIARGMSIITTVLMIFILLIALVLPIFGRQVGIFIFSFLGLEAGFLETWNTLRFSIPPLIIFVVAAVIYWAAPNVKLDFKSVLAGSTFTAIGWLGVSFGFSVYINNFANYSATYGGIGGVIMLMLWLYVSAILLMVGGQINAVMQSRRDVIKRFKRYVGPS
ncbi:YihY/virulence factor BrkB family protein [Planococcus salinarum]|uniref:YihY/virulence factor BrkB family protein n=1 Tax=Planococcus salinarum TaxID=622695 RepID=UPI000E3D875C|nr:YihY/virulence factor BrkB family protein [Planococcus salinarum]TAA71757.1 YihY/virulence factor BrkB family protein [Planococcus salinarum]